MVYLNYGVEVLACHQLSRFFPVPVPHRQRQRVYRDEEDDAAEVSGVVVLSVNG